MSKQKVIVGIDYSKSCINALKYADLLAYHSNSELLLFHLYDAPVFFSNSGLYFISSQSVAKTSKDKLKLFTEKNLKDSRVVYSAHASSGVFEDVVKDLAKKNKVQAIVLGLESKTKINRFIYGTSSTSILGKVQCPVVIVPESYKTHKLSKTLLAVDNAEGFSKGCLKTIKSFVNGTQSKLEVYHIKTPFEVFSDKKEQTLKVDANLTYPVKVKKAKEAVDGIVGLSKSLKADAIMSISRKHSFVYRFFNESNSKEIAFRSRVPVVVIHE